MKQKCKIWTFVLALFWACALFTGCTGGTGFTEKEGRLTLEKNGLTVVLDSATGMLKELSSPEDSLLLEGVTADAGLDGAYLFGQLGYTGLSSLATYELPLLWPKMAELPEYSLNYIKTTKQGFAVSVTRDVYTFLYRYTVMENGLSLSVELSTSSEENIPVNGTAFLVQGIEGYDLDKTTFEFPGSTPDGRTPFRNYTRYKAAAADYCAPVVQFTDGSRFTNILFVNETEKWTSGCYYNSDARPCAAFLSAVEGYISKDSPMEIGTLYLPLLHAGEDAYKAVSDFWAQAGYHVPDETSATENLQAIYSGHPYGTMDTNYQSRLTLQEYAGGLPEIAQMGFSAVWLLPVFQHTGDNVYEPIDQGLIDARYGGLDGAAAFIEAAHGLDMKVLFDFVPHGPRPVYPFAKEHDDWISKDKNGANQIEWECISLDYNHPDYYDYTVKLTQYYAETIGLDGARIDCSMGGLPNWSSASGYRASASGLQAGVNIVRAIREGFEKAGTVSLLLPENFHPSPAYAACTDVFYDMPLYRCLYDLNQSGAGETEYVSRLRHFLEAEQKTSVAGQKKLRFLGNHDTVTWTFDAQRAQTLYGPRKARAMWMAMGWIDGVLYIYQGDEDPAAYGLEGENLTGFFTRLLDAKRDFLPTAYDTLYVDTGTPVFAFYRYDKETGNARLVLVNLSEEENTYPLKEKEETVLAAIGGYTLSGSQIRLEPYSGVILEAAAVK